LLSAEGPTIYTITLEVETDLWRAHCAGAGVDIRARTAKHTLRAAANAIRCHDRKATIYVNASLLHLELAFIGESLRGDY